MTDKEQIIIGGVDVSECEYVCNTAFGNIGCKLPFNEEIHCCNIPNCYFKQLKRKKQECEELEKTISDFISDNRSMYCYDDRQPVTLDEMQECMEFTYNAGLKYKQTLDEIEKELKEDIYCENQECGCDDFEECLRCTKNIILDIISKAKGNNND